MIHPTAIVDVMAIRRTADRNDFATEFRDHTRRNFIGSSVRGIDNDLEVGEIHPLGDRCLAELLVIHARRSDVGRPPQTARLACRRCCLQIRFDGLLDSIGELFPVPIEELDAVIVERIV